MKTLTQNNVMRKISKLVILPLVLILGACSSNYTPETDQSSNYDFTSVKTYNIVGDDTYKNPMFSDIDRDRLEDAIQSSMQQRGKFAVDENNADVLISYFMVTKDKVRVNYTYNGGYYNNCYRCGYGYGGGVSHISTHDYVEGTLVVDIIDNDSDRSVYRSTLTKPLKSYDTAQEREQAINKIVNDMMKALPIS